MERYNKLLSIIIPTKNRYECLVPVVKTILKNVVSQNFELIIQDNSDDNKSVVDFFKLNNDNRLKYYYASESLSITGNTTNAIDNTIGKYITFIGDDDLVSPYISHIVELLDIKNIDCLIYNTGYYWWDSVKFANPTSFCNKNILWIPANISMDLIYLDPKTEMDKVLDNGGTHYGSLPRFYHGIVKKSVLEEIKTRTGTYLPGACPDMTFAASISQVIDSYCYINYPVSVFGASKNSGAGWGANKTHYGKIEEMTFLPSGIIDRWDPKLPKIWSGQTTNAQALYEVLKAFKVKKEINYTNFYGSMLANEPILKGYVLPLVRKSAISNFGIYFKVFNRFFKTYLKLLVMNKYLFIRFKTGKFKYVVSEKKSVEDCMVELLKFPVNLSSLKMHV